MPKRTDPLVPILGSAVAIVVLGAIALVFYPRISRWFGPEKASVVGQVEAPDGRVPIWLCRSVPGVALLLEDSPDTGAVEAALEGGPYHYLRLSIYNFADSGGRPYRLELAPFTSPEGGPPALPAASRLRAEGVPAHLSAVLRGLGASSRIEVAPGRRGQALLLLPSDPALRRSFACGDLMFRRTEIERARLALWRAQPTLKQFEDF